MNTMEDSSVHIRTDGGGVSEGVPTFFRALCSDASGGGNHSYSIAGWHLGLHAPELVQASVHELPLLLQELQSLLNQHDDEGVLAWFDRELPACMELVPRRRRPQFLLGVYAFHEVVTSGRSRPQGVRQRIGNTKERRTE